MRYNNIRYLFAMVIMMVAIACNTETETNQKVIPQMDSMPVITPHTSDTDAIINPPSTNDDNVILPDSQIRTQ